MAGRWERLLDSLRRSTELAGDVGGGPGNVTDRVYREEMREEKNLFTQLSMQTSLAERLSMICVRTMRGKEVREIVMEGGFCEERDKEELDI